MAALSSPLSFRYWRSSSLPLKLRPKLSSASLGGINASLASSSSSSLSSTSSSSSSSLSSSSPCSIPEVVVTRERGKNRNLIEALAVHGISCLELPLILHERSPDFDRLASLLSKTEFDWIIITSPEAGVVFLDAWRDAGNPRVKIGAVGSGTANVFEEVNRSSTAIEIAFVPSKATGKVLASELPRCGDEACSVLYPASAKASNEVEEGLLNRGFHVTRLNTYTTVPVRQVDKQILEVAIVAPVIAVASPSAIRSWAEIVPSVGSWNNIVVCIGETTGLAAKKIGFQKVYYPENPGLEGWVRCILDALRVHRQSQEVLQR